MSTFTNKIDAKGRVSMPADFRDLVARSNETGIIIYKTFDKQCLSGCMMPYFMKLSDAISNNFDPFSKENDYFNTAIFADSVALEIDKDGRINIPKKYTQYANISDLATFVGKGQTFEIWNPTDYEKYYEESRKYAIEHRSEIKYNK